MRAWSVYIKQRHSTETALPDPLELILVTIDREAGKLVLTRSDRKEATFDFDRDRFAPTSLLSRLDWSPSIHGLVATTVHGDSLVFELPASTGDGLDGRLSVYLDQPHWSTFQKLAEGRAAVDPDDAAAAKQLAEWAEARLIVLPASAGHYSETTKWSKHSARYTLVLQPEFVMCGVAA
jgi:hypothetical protein